MSSAILRRLLKYKISDKYLYCGVIINKRNFTTHSNIIKSPLPDVEISNEPISEFIFKNFSKFPHKIAVVSLVFFTLLVLLRLRICVFKGMRINR